MSGPLLVTCSAFCKVPGRLSWKRVMATTELPESVINGLNVGSKEATERAVARARSVLEPLEPTATNWQRLMIQPGDLKSLPFGWDEWTP